MTPRTTPRMFPAQPGPQPAPRYGRPGGGGRAKWIISAILVAVALAGLMTLPRYFSRRANVNYKAAVKDRADALKRWTAWLGTGSCLRHDDSARWADAVTKAAAGAREALTDALSHDPFVDHHCAALLRALETDTELPSEAQKVVHDWVAANRPLDKPADKPGEELRDKLDTRDHVRERAQTKLIPPVREQIRKIQGEHAAKHDYIWWQIELGLQVEDVLDHGIAAHKQGKDIQAVIGAPLHKLIEQMHEADASVGVRVMPSLEALARASGDAAWTALQAVEDNGAWSRIEEDNAVLGPMPPEPQGCDFSL